METIHIANLACGGHAGDAETVGVFRTLAEKNRVAVSAHLSYPDTEHFGRISMDMAPWSASSVTAPLILSTAS